MVTTSKSISDLIGALRCGLLVSVFACIPFAGNAAIKQTIGGLTLYADGLDADLVKNQLVLTRVTISQEGGYEIKADEARGNGIDLEKNEWAFTGNVKITSPTGSSTADSAIGKFANDEITELHIVGQPATFKENRPDLQFMLDGRANRIDYDLVKQQVQLSGNVLLKQFQLEPNQQIKYKGQVELKGQTVLYDMAKQSISASKDPQGEQLEINVTPDNEPETGKNKAGAAKP
ncbi:MAG: LptA/OstA family protein [Steroidobacteraceae bacterium]